MTNAYDWNVEKNQLLISQRNISFEQIVQCIDEGRLLDIVDHPNKPMRSNQQIFVIEFNDYCYLVPFVRKENEYFLKTIIPSRKHTKIYLKGKG